MKNSKTLRCSEDSWNRHLSSLLYFPTLKWAKRGEHIYQEIAQVEQVHLFNMKI